MVIQKKRSSKHQKQNHLYYLFHCRLPRGKELKTPMESSGGITKMHKQLVYLCYPSPRGISPRKLSISMEGCTHALQLFLLQLFYSPLQVVYSDFTLSIQPFTVFLQSLYNHQACFTVLLHIFYSDFTIFLQYFTVFLPSLYNSSVYLPYSFSQENLFF